MLSFGTGPESGAPRVAVCGDLIADRYVYASPRRLSREAPVMVLRHERERLGAGGAANVAVNLAALGARVSAFGALGDDESGEGVRAVLAGLGVDTGGVARDGAWRTPTKTRILAAEARRFPHQVLRIDREPDAPLPAEARGAIVRSLADAFDDAAALLVSDYGYGAVGEELAAEARRWAAAGRVVVLDPRERIDGFAGIDALTPNVGELARFVGVDPRTLDDPRALREAARTLRDRVGCQRLLVTRGNLGMALFGDGVEDGGLAVAASGAREVTDVSGAGDTSAAVFALSLAAGDEPAEAMRLANLAAGVVVMENGTAVCPLDRLAALAEDAGGPPVVPLGEERSASKDADDADDDVGGRA